MHMYDFVTEFGTPKEPTVAGTACHGLKEPLGCLGVVVLVRGPRPGGWVSRLRWCCPDGPSDAGAARDRRVGVHALPRAHVPELQPPVARPEQDLVHVRRRVAQDDARQVDVEAQDLVRHAAPRRGALVAPGPALDEALASAEQEAADRLEACVEIKILRRVRVVLHAIDATQSRRRGDAGSSPIDQARTTASSPRNDLGKNCRVPG